MASGVSCKEPESRYARRSRPAWQARMLFPLPTSPHPNETPIPSCFFRDRGNHDSVMGTREKYFAADRYRNVEGILGIVRDGLCHRCGACIGVCPVGTFGIDDHAYPKQVDNCIECNICVRVCPGLAVDYPALGEAMFPGRYQFGSLMGPVLSTYIGPRRRAGRPQAGRERRGDHRRFLPIWLETGRIKGALVTVEDPEEPRTRQGHHRPHPRGHPARRAVPLLHGAVASPRCTTSATRKAPSPSLACPARSTPAEAPDDGPALEGPDPDGHRAPLPLQPAVRIHADRRPDARAEGRKTGPRELPPARRARLASQHAGTDLHRRLEVALALRARRRSSTSSPASRRSAAA